MSTKNEENKIRSIKKYHCEVDYTCPILNSMKSVVEHNVTEENVKKSLVDSIEKLRESISKLRDWGHDLRLKLLQEEIKNGSIKS